MPKCRNRPSGPDALGCGRDEGDDVVMYFGFDLSHARGVDPGLLAHNLRRFCRDNTALGERLANTDLDLEHQGIAMLVRPNLAQLWSGITFNHRVALRA